MSTRKATLTKGTRRLHQQTDHPPKGTPAEIIGAALATVINHPATPSMLRSDILQSLGTYEDDFDNNNPKSPRYLANVLAYHFKTEGGASDE